jgi:hypothetical protein
VPDNLLRFGIFALPRSRTAWLSALLTAHGYKCCHEPKIVYPEASDLRELSRLGIRGISDPSIYLTERAQLAVHFVRNPTVVILRDPVECRVAFERWLGRPVGHWEALCGAFRGFVEAFAPLEVTYAQLDDFGAVSELVCHLTGRCADREVFRMFCLLNIQQSKSKAEAMMPLPQTAPGGPR